MAPRGLTSALLHCLLRPFALILLFFQREFPGRGIPSPPYLCAILIFIAFTTLLYFTILLRVRRRERRRSAITNSVDNGRVDGLSRMSCELQSSMTSPSSSVALLRARLTTGPGSSQLPILNTHSPRPTSARILNEHDLPLTSSPVSSFREIFLKPSLQCHINKLPTELLTIIFQFMIPPRQSSGFLDIYVPVLAGRRVCQRWRDIIDEAHPLWKSLWPSLKKNHDPMLFQWYQDIINGIKVLSDITIELPPNLYEDQRPAFDIYLYRYLLNLIPKSGAFKFIANGMLSDSYTPSYIFSVNPIHPVSRKLSDGEDLPHLRHLHWHTPRFAFAKSFPSQMGVPWSSLRALPWKQFLSVTLCLPLTLHDCKLLLDNMDCIEYLSIETISDSGINISYRTTLRVLPNLRHLDLHSEVNIVPLFRQYSMPALRQVKLMFSAISGSNNLHLLNIPWACLKELSIRSKLWRATAVAVLQSLAQVEKLDWIGGLDSDGEWSGMQRLPHLRTLRVKQEAQEFSGYNMARQLVQQVVPHTLVSLDLPFIPEEDIVDRFTSLTEANLHRPISSEQLLLFLSHAKNLQTGTFIITDPSNSNFSPLSSPIFSPELSFPIMTPDTSYPSITSNISTLSLTLQLQDTDTQTLFDALSFPHLSSLIINVNKAASSKCRGFSEMLNRSRSPISKLTLHHAHLDDDTLEQCLAMISSTLVDLELQRTTGAPPFGSRLFQALTHSPIIAMNGDLKGLGGGGGGRGEGVVEFDNSGSMSNLPLTCLCPNLERCHITFPHIDPWLENMIMSRLGSDDDGDDDDNDNENRCLRCGSVIKKLKAVGGVRLKDNGGSWIRLKKVLANYGVRDSLDFTDPPPFM